MTPELVTILVLAAATVVLLFAPLLWLTRLVARVEVPDDG